MSSSQHSGYARGREHSSKIAIPRLERRDEPPRKQARSRLDRVPRACLSCRARKIRCNGEQPSCKHCRDSESQCIYASSRKDRLKVATEHNEEMLQFLKSLRADVGDVERMKIDQLLADVAADVADAAAAIQKSPSKLRNTEGEPDAELEEGEANISAEVGSNEDLDNMNEDILRNEQSRATGYVGKNSEVQWLRQLNHEAVTAASHGKDVYRGPYGPPGSNARAWADREAALRQRQMQDPVPQVPTSNFNFNLDGETIDMDFMVDPFDLPPLETADRLVRCYMDTVHKTFPILPKKTFVNQFYHYYAALAQGQPYQLPRKWQAMLNLVFAIGAVFSHLTDAEWRADERDHFIYHSRAWALSLKDPWWFSDPDLPQTQITALLAFYYLAIGHTNRSWIVVGMAVRSSFSLGLHVRNEDRTATAVKKEILARIWWGVYTLERLLSVITGRPSVGIESQCSVYLPLPISCDDFEEARIQALFGTRPRPTTADDSTVSEASSASSSRGFDSPLNSRGPANSGTYLTSTVKLGKISQRILTEIYSPSVIKRSWKDVQRIITEIMEDLERWAASLPTGLDVLSHDRGDQPMTYERRNLTVYYHSTKILMTRPCLCRLDRRIPNQSQGSNDFNHRMATICVSSAKSLAALLPDDMVNERSRIYEIFPWWTAVHYIMQSLAILMFDLSDKGPPASGGNNTVAVLKKLVRWLRALRSTNGMARRAHSIILNLLQKMVVSIPIDMSDLINEDLAESLPTEHTPPDADLFTQSHMTDDFLEHYQESPFNNYCGYQNQTQGSNPGTYSYPFPRGNQFHQSLYNRSPLTHFFLTEFDQYNPLPFTSQDVFMGYYQPDGSGGMPVGGSGGTPGVASGGMLDVGSGGILDRGSGSATGGPRIEGQGAGGTSFTY